MRRAQLFIIGHDSKAKYRFVILAPATGSETVTYLRDAMYKQREHKAIAYAQLFEH